MRVEKPDIIVVPLCAQYLVKTAVTQTAPSMDVPYSAFAKVVEQLNDELHPEEVMQSHWCI